MASLTLEPPQDAELALPPCRGVQVLSLQVKRGEGRFERWATDRAALALRRKSSALQRGQAEWFVECGRALDPG